MADDTYVLDLLVTGAEAVSVNDDGTGTDTIRVRGAYAATIDIDLAWTIVSGMPMNAESRYVSADLNSHRLVINGLIENAFGSNGTEYMRGNDGANLLSGDIKRMGPGMADTLWGAGGDDTIFGGAGGDDLHGEAENDALWGDAGDDTVYGGVGRDTVEGGAGADWLEGGGDAGDTLSYAASRRGVQVRIDAGAVTLAHGGDAEGDRIAGFVNVVGSGGQDRIEMADKTTLPDGKSDNQVYGGGARDRVALGGGDDSAFGGGGNDLILGEVGDDSLSGDNGKDRLNGGAGQDALTGGIGADHFVFAATGDSAVDRPDVITDFTTLDQDKIDLRAIDAMANRIGNQAFHLIAGDFTGAQGEVRAQISGNDLRISGDTDGDGLADFTIVLRDCQSVTSADFTL